MMSYFIKLFIIYLFLLVDFIPVQAQEVELLSSSQVLIHKLFGDMKKSSDDQVKEKLSDSIANTLFKTLKYPGSFKFPFDSLKNIGIIGSSDGHIRIYTWNLPYENGTSKFFGFIQYKDEKSDSLHIFRLTDKSDDIQDPTGKSLGVDNWYGALYYEMVEKKFEGNVYYTLIGYHPENISVSQKVIDVLTFTPDYQPVLGKPIFNFYKKVQYRIIFEYSARAQMSVRWNESMKLIVFDHLSPADPMYTGNFQYYGPDFSFDALKFEDGNWQTVEDIDVRNMPR